jgi:hypothetical protein
MDFPRRKLRLALIIMGAGLLVAVAWCAWQGLVMHRGYPHNTFLFKPDCRFSDTGDLVFASRQTNPYVEPAALYGPFAWLLLRFFSTLPDGLVLIGYFYLSLAFLLLLLLAALESVCRTGWGCALAALALMGWSYPLLICFDRGNIEIVVVALVAGGVMLMSRGHFRLAALCLAPAISLKIYPAFLLVLMARQRRPGAAVLALAVAGVLTALSLHGLGMSPAEAWHSYHRNIVYMVRGSVLGNLALQNSASPWNAFKVVLGTLAHWSHAEPVDFSFHGPFITTSYSIYTGLMAALAAVLAVHAAVVEKEFLRAVLPLLVYLSICAPIGGDYRLLHVEIAMVVLICLRSRRRFDVALIVLFALILVPKKEIILSYLGKTESDFADVSINAVINPVLILTVLALLLADGWAGFDPKWTRMRLQSLVRMLLPRRRPEATA